MPPPIPVTLEPHDPSWTVKADQLANELGVLGSVLVAVHHIGSTAVSGLAAKPIFDLMPVVSLLSHLDQERHVLEALGYQSHGELGMAGRRYFTLSNPQGMRLAQLHCFEAGSSHVTRHLAFRDYLRAHPAVSRDYEIEKRRAMSLYPHDSHAYGNEKSAWVGKVEQGALIWYAHR